MNSSQALPSWSNGAKSAKIKSIVLCLLTNSGVISPKKELRLISLCRFRIEGMSFSTSFIVLPEFSVQSVNCPASMVPLLISLISEF